MRAERGCKASKAHEVDMMAQVSRVVATRTVDRYVGWSGAALCVDVCVDLRQSIPRLFARMIEIGLAQ
jgi:hypothetical protein